MIPVVFRTPRSLATLNVAGVGLAIGALTTAVSFMSHGTTPWPLIVGIPSVIVGSLWASMLRRREKVNKVPVGWILSVPLAALNGSLACALLLAFEAHALTAFIGGLFLGATFGVIFWAPGLILVLLLFGLPIARARKLAREGLAGEERGEGFVGFVCAVLSLAAVLLALSQPGVQSAPSMLLFFAMAWFGLVSGVAAMWIAGKREALRRRFVARVEANEVAGLRIESRGVGKMLVRVDDYVETYRLPPPGEEELFELGLDGSAKRAYGEVIDR